MVGDCSGCNNLSAASGEAYLFTVLMQSLLPPTQWLEARDASPLHVKSRFLPSSVFGINELDGLIERGVSLHTAERSPMRNYHDISMIRVVVRDGESWTGKAGAENQSMPMAALKHGFRKGFSVLLNGMQARVPSIATLCEQIEDYTGGTANANLYLTPAGAQGFEVHFDHFDGIVLQLSGRKTWRLWQPLEASQLPSIDMKFKPSLAAVSGLPPPRRLLLNEGDVLYVPRGWLHEASTPPTEDQSMHLTIGLLGASRVTLETLLHATLRTRRGWDADAQLLLMHAAIRAAAATPHAAAMRRSLTSIAPRVPHYCTSNGPADSGSDDGDGGADTNRASELAALNASLRAALPSLDAQLEGSTPDQLLRLACTWGVTARAALSSKHESSEFHVLPDHMCEGSSIFDSSTPIDWTGVRDATLRDLMGAARDAMQEEATTLARARESRMQYLAWHAA